MTGTKTVVLRFFARWRDALRVARRRHIQEIAKKGLSAIE